MILALALIAAGAYLGWTVKGKVNQKVRHDIHRKAINEEKIDLD